MGSITVTELGKAYKTYPSRWGRLAEWIDPRGRPRHELHWVLKDVSFHVRRGQSVGLIGANGAGKSTLLKLITGTTLPTQGSIDIKGRVAALLELGIGFHPDFTGRQNAIMAGQLLGHPSDYIEQRMSDIVDFAEIEASIDAPTRVYSSGMQMRLAFSVATLTRPDILIVDEALSVGDAYFQHKCFDRIRKFQSDGTTLLLVSHDRQAIQAICDEAILLDHGQCIMQGPSQSVIDYYNAILANQETQTIRQTTNSDGQTQTSSGSRRATIESVHLLDAEGNDCSTIEVGDNVALVITCLANDFLDDLVIGYMIRDRLGEPIFGTNTHYLNHQYKNISQGTRFGGRFKFLANLGPGTYSVSVALHGGADHRENNLEWRDLAFIFEVSNTRHAKFEGKSWIPPHFEEMKSGA